MLRIYSFEFNEYLCISFWAWDDRKWGWAISFPFEVPHRLYCTLFGFIVRC
jgi:hypothetical protein